MAVLNIAIVGEDGFARSIAKPSDHRDVDTYVHKTGTGEEARILSLIRPTRYPERLRPLLTALVAARAGVLQVRRIDATFGESLVAFAAAGIEHGLLIFEPEEGGWIDEERAMAMVRQAGLDAWKAVPSDANVIRASLQDLLDRTESNRSVDLGRPLAVPVDQHFNVKGIGLVAIGYVQCGRIAVHDEVQLLPAGRIATVRSLQVMDDDVTEAIAGDRVGIALRNAGEADLPTGSFVIHPEQPTLETHSASSMTVKWSPFQTYRPEPDDVLHASLDLQFIVGRVRAYEEDRLTIEWDRPIMVRALRTDRMVLSRLEAPLRILGHAVDVLPAEL